MPEFLNPFTGTVPRKITKAELIRALRLNVAAEEEAVHLYEAHAEATDIPLAAQVLRDIAREERVHMGEFHRLITILMPDEAATMAEGAAEVDELAGGLGGASQGNGGPTAGAPERPIHTVGNLRA